MLWLLILIQYFRVLEYDTETKEVTVMMENLRFPNGIQLLPDEESVLVAETTMARIRRQVSILPFGGYLGYIVKMDFTDFSVCLDYKMLQQD